MNSEDIPDNPYILLTPGPLSTTKSVRAAMLRDWCTWDDEYNAVVQAIRAKLVSLATRRKGYTSVLMQGSGTFCVEAAIGSAVPREGKILILANGAYGERMGAIAERLGIPARVIRHQETEPLDPDRVRGELAADGAVTHVAFVHCETTTGMLNPLFELTTAVREAGRALIVDAMSSFGGIPIDAGALGIDFLISSANKCIQGVPGFGFVIARTAAMEGCAGHSRSLSLDLFDQWRGMEEGGGKWRFTSPTHVVHAFSQALAELEAEGGVASRFKRYTANQRALVKGMRALGFECLLPPELHSPVITSFVSPRTPGYQFRRFYGELKTRGFVIYPGKVSKSDTFRIGTIGDVRPHVISSLIAAVGESMYWTRGGRRQEPQRVDAVSLT